MNARFACFAALLVASATAARAQAPMRLVSAPPRIVDAAEMQRIAFQVAPERDEKSEPEREVAANRYLEPYWTYAKVPLPSPPLADEAEVVAAANAFDYVHTPDVAFDGPSENGYDPADCHMAVGFSHVVTVINSEFWIYDKKGTRIYNASLISLFGVSPGYVGSFDPKVRYDRVRGRFYMLALDRHGSIPRAQYKLAISLTSDPTQGWYIYEFQNESGGRGIDYPELGFGPRGLYLTGNFIQFAGWPAPNMGFRGSTWVLDLAALVQGANVTYWLFDDMRGSNNEVVGTLKTPGASQNSAPGIDAVTIALGSGATNFTRRALFYGWTLPVGFPSSAPTFSRPFIEIAESAPVPNARELGGPAQVITNNLGSVFLGASMSNGRIATALPVEGNGRCNTRTYSFDVSNWPSVSVAHTLDFTGTASGYDFYWPNSAHNTFGEQGVVYSQSSPTQYISSYWTMRQSDQTAYAQYGLVGAGAGYYGQAGDTPASAYRWGDYAGIDVDPEGQGFWYFDSRASDVWYIDYETRVVHVPHAEFVDGSNPGSQGTRAQPWGQVISGFNNAFNGNDVVIRTGNYTIPAGTLITKRLRVIADGGPVLIAP